MMRRTLYAYQWLAGISDAATGAALCIAPAFTLRMMGVQAPADAAPYLSYIGAFVFSVGAAGLYGAWIFNCSGVLQRLETVWLLTAFSRAAVAIFIAKAVLDGTLQTGWIPVALFDAACVVIQAIGLRRRWLAHAA